MGSAREHVDRRRSSRADFGKMMRHICITIVTLSLALTIGCEEKDQYTLRFSHKLHVAEMEMECLDCHGQVPEGEILRPDHDTCVACHEESIETDDISRETCGTCHVEKDLQAIGEEREPKRPLRGVFRHCPALADQCARCHGYLLEDGEPRTWKRPAVVGMRELAPEMGLQCSNCHEGMDRDWRPQNHLRRWINRHGVLAQEDDATCYVCHQEVTCRECHQSQQPDSHNNLWRLQTHGIEATWARERCMTCHQDDSCAACHSEMQPRSHTARWESRHCTICHELQQPGRGCGVCHEGDFRSIHDPIMPDWHVPQWPDYLCFDPICHGGGAPAAGKTTRR